MGAAQSSTKEIVCARRRRLLRDRPNPPLVKPISSGADKALRKPRRLLSRPLLRRSLHPVGSPPLATAKVASAALSPLDAWINKVARRVGAFSPKLKAGCGASPKRLLRRWQRRWPAWSTSAHTSPNSSGVPAAASSGNPTAASSRRSSGGASDDCCEPADAAARLGGGGEGGSRRPTDAVAGNDSPRGHGSFVDPTSIDLNSSGSSWGSGSSAAAPSSSQLTGGQDSSPIRAPASLDTSADREGCEQDAAAAATAAFDAAEGAAAALNSSSDRSALQPEASCTVEKDSPEEGTRPGGGVPASGNRRRPVRVELMSTALMELLGARLGPPAARLAGRAAAALVPQRWPTRGVRVWPSPDTGSETKASSVKAEAESSVKKAERPVLGSVLEGAGCPASAGAAPTNGAPSRAAGEDDRVEASGRRLLQLAKPPAAVPQATAPKGGSTEAAVEQPTIGPEHQRSIEAEAAKARIQLHFRADAAGVFDSGTLLGAGGEGEVRRVELFGSSFAVKRSDARGARDGRYVDTLPSAWVQLPLTRVRSLGVDGSVFQLFPLAAGDLGHALAAVAAHGTLAPSEFRALFAELAVAVGVLHGAGLRHADVKPQNLLVTLDNRLIIADLGLTDEAAEEARGSGTRGFAAPEQESLGSDALDLLADACEYLGDAILRRPQRDHRPIDVHALAVTCLCLGAPDWASVKREVAAARRGWGRRRWVPPAWVPADAAPLLKSMLARRPGRRPTMQQVRAHPFFEGTDWAAVEGRRVPLPLDLVALAAEGRRIQGATMPEALA